MRQNGFIFRYDREGRSISITSSQSCLAEANLAEGIDKTITKSVNISLVDNLKMGQWNT